MSAVHFAGGAATPDRSGIRFAGRGFAVCCTGDRAYAIKAAGMQTRHEEDVTCRRCLAIMAKRIDPGADWSAAMGIPRVVQRSAADSAETRGREGR